MASPTIQAKLIVALQHNGGHFVKTVAGGWEQWTAGEVFGQRQEPLVSHFFIGPAGGFRFGRSKAQSRNYPKTRARLLAQYDSGEAFPF